MNDIPKNRPRVSVDLVAFLSSWAFIMQDSAHNDHNYERREISRTHEAEFREAFKQAEADADELEALRARVTELEAAKLEPGVWLRDQRGSYEGPETLDPMFYLGAADPGRGAHGATYSPFYPAPPVQARGEPVAYLHQVVCGDGEPDQALSFAPDNFPLAGVLGYRSLSHEPLYTAPPAPTVDVDAISEEAILRTQRAVWEECGRDVNAKLIRTVVDAIFNKGE